jgi:hypothetical protein
MKKSKHESICELEETAVIEARQRSGVHGGNGGIADSTN